MPYDLIHERPLQSELIPGRDACRNLMRDEEDKKPDLLNDRMAKLVAVM